MERPIVWNRPLTESISLGQSYIRKVKQIYTKKNNCLLAINIMSDEIFKNIAQSFNEILLYFAGKAIIKIDIQ